jgi:hypothetical protein
MQLRYLMITQTNGIWLRQCLSASRSSPPPTIWRVTLKFRARDLTIRRPAECPISKIRLSWRFHRENDLGNPSFRASEANTSHRALQPSFVTTSQILGDTLTHITCATKCDQIDSSSSQYESMFIDWPGGPGQPARGRVRASEEKSCSPAWCDILNRRAEREFAAGNESDSSKGCGFLHPSWIRCDDA